MYTTMLMDSLLYTTVYHQNEQYLLNVSRKV